uniref:Uncharacterized protein n=1 Tax=Anguilla anguilla TaxID=7936 RepID=A0A0E9SU12_ANGAN
MSNGFLEKSASQNLHWLVPVLPSSGLDRLQTYPVLNIPGSDVTVTLTQYSILKYFLLLGVF